MPGVRITLEGCKGPELTWKLFISLFKECQWTPSLKDTIGSHFELLKNVPSWPRKDESVFYFPLHLAIAHNNFLCSYKICMRAHTQTHTCLLLMEEHSWHLANERKSCLFSRLPQFIASQQLTLHPKHTQTVPIPLSGLWSFFRTL